MQGKTTQRFVVFDWHIIVYLYRRKINHKKYIYSYLKCIVYDRLLKPRQSFRITLYLKYNNNKKMMSEDTTVWKFFLCFDVSNSLLKCVQEFQIHTHTRALKGADWLLDINKHPRLLHFYRKILRIPYSKYDVLTCECYVWISGVIAGKHQNGRPVCLCMHKHAYWLSS